MHPSFDGRNPYIPRTILVEPNNFVFIIFSCYYVAFVKFTNKVASAKYYGVWIFFFNDESMKG
jgi:hypothetical protein